MKLIGATAQVEKNEAVRRGGFSPSQWVLGRAPRGVGHLLDEDELGQLGALHPKEDDAAGDFAIRSKYRLSARKAFVKEDCGRKASAALLRKAAPIMGAYEPGDLVCYRKDQGGTEASTRWSAPSRILGMEGSKGVWVICATVPVLTALDKLRPCSTSETLAWTVINREEIKARGPGAAADEQQAFIDARRAKMEEDDQPQRGDHEPQRVVKKRRRANG